MNNKFFKFLKHIRNVLIVFFLITGISFASVSIYLKYHPLNYGKYLEDFLNRVNSYSDKIHVHAEGLDFEWGSISTPLLVRIKNITIHDFKENEIAKFPYVFAEFKLSSLLFRKYIPHRFVIQEPVFDISFKLFKTEEEEINEKMQASIEPIITQRINSLLSFLFNEFDFHHFHILNASGKIKDFVRPLQFSNANLSFDVDNKYVVSSSADVVLKKIPFKASLHSEWNENDPVLPVEITLRNINPSQFKRDKNTILGGMNLPMDIFFNINLDMPFLKNGAEHLTGFIEDATYKIDGGTGIIKTPPPYKARYDIKNLTFSGKISNDGDKFSIEKGIINLQTGASVKLNTSISGLNKLISDEDLSDFKSKLNVTAEKVHAPYLKNYWPEKTGEPARTWVVDNILKGYAPKATLTTELNGSGKKDFEIKTLSAEFPAEKAVVRYLPNTLPITDGSAYLTFTKENLYIDVLGGRTNKAKAIGGTIKIFGFVAEPTKCYVDINVDAPEISDALKILASPDFMLKKQISIKPKDISGRIWGNIKVGLDIYTDLTRDMNLRVKIKSQFENVSLRNYFPNITLSDSSGTLDATVKKVDLKLSSKLNNHPFTAKITQYMDEKTNPETLISAKSTLDIKKFWNNDFVQGEAPISMKGSFFTNETANWTIYANLAPVKINLPFLTYRKKMGEPAHTELNLTIDKKDQIRKIILSYNDQKKSLIKGNVFLDQDKKLKSAHITKLKIGKNNFKGNVFYNSKKNEYTANIAGNAIDVSGVFEGDKTLNITTAKKEKTNKFKLNLSMKLKRLWLINNRSMNDFDFKGKNINENWEHMDISGQFGKQPYKTKLLYYPVKNKDNVYNFMLTSPNGGDTLRVLKLSKNIEGGFLNIRGKIENDHVTGNLSLRNFALNNDAMLVKMAQITSISGIVDAISGKGLLFTSGEFPFEVNDDVITISSSFIKGHSLGVTTSGEYNQKTNTMNFSGTIVPFYSINSLPGKIPLLGTLLRGADGGGFLSQSYKINGTLQKPEFSFPPASVLMPGALKKLFH